MKWSPTGRASQTGGSGGCLSELRIPITECGIEVTIEHLGPSLKEQVRSLGRPLHLLFFHEPFADDLIDGRLHKRRADPITLAPYQSVFLLASLGFGLLDFGRSIESIQLVSVKVKNLAGS